MSKAKTKELPQNKDFAERKERAEKQITELLEKEGLTLLATLKYGELRIEPNLLILDAREIEKQKEEETKTDEKAK